MFADRPASNADNTEALLPQIDIYGSRSVNRRESESSGGDWRSKHADIVSHTLHVSARCAVLCCAVLCCAVLCCAVLCCVVLCCVVLCCPVLSCAVLCCPVLSCAVLCCPVLSCAAPPTHSAIRCPAAHCFRCDASSACSSSSWDSCWQCTSGASTSSTCRDAPGATSALAVSPHPPSMHTARVALTGTSVHTACAVESHRRRGVSWREP
jgi:hypothetical protein